MRYRCIQFWGACCMHTHHYRPEKDATNVSDATPQPLAANVRVHTKVRLCLCLVCVLCVGLAHELERRAALGAHPTPPHAVK